jgi:Tfp pilus assembly protein PilX
MKNRMGSGGERLQNQRGMVLFTSLAILTVLVAVGIGIRVMLQNDYKILSNLRGSTEAFYVSVAGLEWSKDEIAQTASFPPAPVNRVKNFAAGEFAVSFLSPTVVSPLAAKLVVRSVGAIGSSSHALQAQLTKTYDLADAAIALRGNASRVSFSGNSVFISGADHDPSTGNAVTGAKARYAISTSDDTLRGQVVQTLGDPPPQSIVDSNSAAPGVAASGFLPASMISQLANDLCGSSTAFVSAIPSGGSLIVENQTWGSQAAPQLRCIEGLPTVGDGVTLTGTISGAGILIIKDAELILTGSFHWEGLIIITGGEVALKVLGSSNKEILGAVIVNESGSPGSTSAILDIQGNLRLLFSRQGLTRAAGLVPTATLGNIYAVLPSAVSQQYWRTVSP